MPAADSASWLLAGSGDAAWLLALAIALTALASWLACGAVLRLLVAWRVYDEPNRRSSHAVAKPRGAGLAIVQVVLFAWIAAALAAGRAGAGFWAIVARTEARRVGKERVSTFRSRRTPYHYNKEHTPQSQHQLPHYLK